MYVSQLRVAACLQKLTGNFNMTLGQKVRATTITSRESAEPFEQHRKEGSSPDMYMRLGQTPASQGTGKGFPVALQTMIRPS
jgi:hypothetical protein